MFSIKRIILPLILIAAIPAQAQTITEAQPFYFGRWIVTNNSAPHHVTVETDGSYTHSPQLIMLQPPQPGVYAVADLPPNAIILSVNVTMTQEMTSGAPEDFDLDNFTTLIPNANINGDTQLTIGARARTTGGGGGYPDAHYVGEISIDINF